MCESREALLRGLLKEEKMLFGFMIVFLDFCFSFFLVGSRVSSLRQRVFLFVFLGIVKRVFGVLFGNVSFAFG